MIEFYKECYREEVINLILNIQNVEYGLNIQLEEQSDIGDINKNYINDGGNFWVAKEDSNNIIIGTLGLLKIEEGYGVLKKFFIKKEYRGKGYSKLLYNELLKFAKENKFKKILLDTPSVAERSHNFYRKVGFLEITKNELKVNYKYPDRDSKLFLLEI